MAALGAGVLVGRHGSSTDARTWSRRVTGTPGTRLPSIPTSRRFANFPAPACARPRPTGTMPPCPTPRATTASARGSRGGLPGLAAVGPLVDVRRRRWSSCCWWPALVAGGRGGPPVVPADRRRPRRCPGLDGTVEVLRDDHGIPQVYADTAHDLFCAQGFVQAQDRFFEMDVRRHITAGRLSRDVRREHASRPTSSSAPWAGAGSPSRSCRCSSPETRAYLEAYSDGVNAYLARPHARREMSLEYTVLGPDGLDYKPEDWTPVDSLAWLKAMAWDLRGNMDDEIDRGAAVGRPHARADRRALPALPLRPAPRRSSTRARSSTGSSSRTPPRGGTRNPPRPRVRRRRRRALARAARGRCAACPTLLGKRRRHRLATLGRRRRPLHDRQAAPGQRPAPRRRRCRASGTRWACTARRVGADCPFDVAGFTFSGRARRGDRPQPATSPGASPTSAPTSPTSTSRRSTATTLPVRRHGSGRCAMRDETIKVAGGDAVHAHGARRPGTARCSPTSRPSSATVGAQRAGRRPARRPRQRLRRRAARGPRSTPGTTADAIFELDRATDWDAVPGGRRATSRCPAQNLVYADRAGHIGYQAPGPDPDPQVRQRRRLPGAGLAAGRTTGPATYVPFDALPSVLDPADGLRRHRQPGGDRPGLPLLPRPTTGTTATAASGSATCSSARRELSASRTWPRIQLDTRNGFAPTLVPYLLDDLHAARRTSPAASGCCSGWDFHQAADSAAAAYYNAVWRNLLALTFHDELPRVAVARRRRPLVRGDAPAARRARQPVVGRRRPPTASSRPATTSSREAMTDARDELTGARPGDAVDWTWGHLHRLDLQNQTLGQSGIGAGRVAVQPRRLPGRRRRRDRRRDRAGTPADGLRRRPRRRRCGWWSRWPTSTRPAGST